MISVVGLKGLGWFYFNSNPSGSSLSSSIDVTIWFFH